MKNATKSSLHPQNKHKNGYDFEALTESLPELKSFVILNKVGKQTIDFSNPKGVKLLNQALLKYHYNINYWELPPKYLCPPVPGRADYMHHISGVLKTAYNGKIPTGNSIKVFDVGVGANCIFPLIGHREFGWHFVGSERDKTALKSAQNIIKENGLSDKIECRFQEDSNHIFEGIIEKEETFDLVICNPPFHASKAQAKAQTNRKWKNLGIKKDESDLLNFGGIDAELFYSNGEKGFVSKMIKESVRIKTSCLWFSSLISKKANLPRLQNLLNSVDPAEVKIIEMAQGQKVSRILAWTFFNKRQQNAWMDYKWK